MAQRHSDEFIVMVMVQAGTHLAGELSVPRHMRLVFLPPYSPELNPAEHLWDSLREDCLGNHVLAYLDAVERALTAGLVALEANPAHTRSMTGFKRITAAILDRKLLSCHHGCGPSRRGWQRVGVRSG